jgi:hypothetical protein
MYIAGMYMKCTYGPNVRFKYITGMYMKFKYIPTVRFMNISRII